MYKKFFMGIAAVAALTLVSCSSDDLNSLSDNSSKNEAISFDGYLGRSAVSVNGSRASELKIADLQASKDGFGVFGNYSSTEGTGTTPTYGNNWFDNQQVTYNKTESKWKYTPLKYWLPKGHIDFLAYAPFNAGKVKDPYSIDFNVSPTIADQIDLLWAHADNQTKANPVVTFNFNHALAKIGYTVKTNVEGTATITLKNITLAGSAPKDPLKTAFYTKGTIDLSKPNGTDLWTTPTPAEKRNYEWYKGTYTVTTSPTHPDNNRDKDYLFVIPQNFESGKDDLYVIVEYTINYKLGKPGTMETMDYTVSSKIEKNFEQGKAYMINLNIGLTPIEFNATVNAWPINDKITNYDIPLK